MKFKGLLFLVVFILLSMVGVSSAFAAKGYGYYTDKKNITFYYYAKNYKDGKIKSVNVAGSFNKWVPTLKSYKMWYYAKKKMWLLTKSKASIRTKKKGTSGLHEFKFVVNKSEWQQPPKGIKNKVEDGVGGININIIKGHLKK